jgi:hypothetical protein
MPEEVQKIYDFVTEQLKNTNWAIDNIPSTYAHYAYQGGKEALTCVKEFIEKQ